MEQRNNGSDGKELTASQLKVLATFEKARANHLNENFDKARTRYQELIKSEQIKSIHAAARFFLGVTYFDQDRYVEAENYFKHAIVKHKNDLWVNSEYRFLAESLIAQGKINEAKIWLGKATSQGAQVRLRNLDQSSAISLTSFISY